MTLTSPLLIVSSFVIWVDADNCHSKVQQFIKKFSATHKVQCVFVSNKKVADDNPSTKHVIVPKQKEAADNYIFSNAHPNDIVITRDILFAKRLVQKGIYTINDRGLTFTKNNIDNLVKERNFNLQISQLGLTKKTPRYSNKDFAEFLKGWSTWIRHNK